MTLTKSLYLPAMVLVATSSLAFARQVQTQTAGPRPPDFSGIWRLDDQHSDSPLDISARLRAEKKAEQPIQPPAGASAGTPSAAQSTNRQGGRGGHGMGGGGMGGGHGHGGGRHHDTPADADSGTPVADDPPPLLADDSMMNVQQDAKDIHVVFGGKDQLDGRLDGIVRQSLSGNAMVQSRLTANSLQVSMQFDGEVRLQESWVESPDGHHLTVTESWTSPAATQPILFRRSYDRLDI
jgi:hypothetical protein